MRIAADWSQPPERLELPEGVAHIWLASLDVTFPDDFDAASGLTDDELERAARFRFDRDRSRYVAAHIVLRRLLGRYLGVTPRSVPLVRLAGGKPALAADAAPAFNMSHAADLGLFGFRHGGSIGVDVERIRSNMDIDSIAGRFFTPAESQYITGTGGDAQLRRFFTTWVRKEAVLKAVGQGLAMPLTSIEVSPDRPARPLVATLGNDPASVWQIVDLPAATDYLAALATTVPLHEVRCFAFGAVRISPAG